MAEQSGKRRGRPRKAVVEPEVAAPSEGAPDQRAGDGPDRPSHAGPANWAEVTPILLKIEAEHGLIGRISIPFTGPALYVRPSFGAKVVPGAEFTVLCFSGVLLKRSEARRVGKECVRTGRFRWSPFH